jgi:hypothetical protein
MGELDYLLKGSPTEKVRWHREDDVYGDPVFGGRRTIAHLEWTDSQARARFPSARNVGIQVLQGGFNTDVPASAGTHDYDGCVDFFIPGVGWWDQQWFFRTHGWGCWYRYPPSFGSHIHGISLGCKGRMGVYVPGQIGDYYGHRTGLAGHAHDPSKYPSSIPRTIFNYSHWIKETDEMANYSDWPAADKKALAEDVVKALLATDLYPGDDKRDVTVAQALKRAAEK